MASSGGRDGPALSEQLFDQAHQFDFFQAVRLLRWMAVESARHDPAASRHAVGYDFAPEQEAVRLRVTASHAFAAGAVREVRPAKSRPESDMSQGNSPSLAGAEEGDSPIFVERKLGQSPESGQSPERKSGPSPAGPSSPPEMVTTFFGLTGPQGVLPRHYTTLLIERNRAKDFALGDFLDMFHHRLLSLFYRAWEKYRFAFAYEQQATGGGEAEDPFTCCLYCLIGMGTGGLHGRLAFDDEALLFYAGHFSHWPRSAIALEGVLRDYFGLPIVVRQFQGQWLYLSPDDQSSLPCARWPEGLHAQLGADVVIGERVWDVESKFRVEIGPLDYGEFRRLMPCGDMLRPLVEMVCQYVGPHLEFDSQLILKAREVPWCRLGGDSADPARLGWNTWVRSGEFEHDVFDAVFSLEL